MDFRNWWRLCLIGVCSALCLFGMAASSSALSDHPVISEFLVDTSGVQGDWEFVEIYNPTGEVIDIGGWDIAYKPATSGSFTAVATIPLGRLIVPFGYFLIGGSKVSPDYLDASLGFASAGGNIAFRKASTNEVVDKVGYGTGDSPEGSAAPAPPKNQSLERKPGAASPAKGNGQDQDNNLNDFLIRAAIQPQNAASGPEYPDSNVGTVTTTLSNITSLSDVTDVIVTDPDRDNKSTVAESFAINVKSQADPTGITLVVKETANSASTFSLQSSGGPLGVTGGASSASNRKIRVQSSDIVTVTYHDMAPSADWTTTISVNVNITPPTVQQERDEIFTLLAYSIAYIDSQTNAQTGRGYNIAAVLLNKNDSIVYWARNCVNRDSDFSAHAEVQSMEGYVRSTRGDSLASFRLYTTLEPCAMCAGMSVLGALSWVVYGQTDSGSGGVLQILQSAHRTTPTPTPSPTIYRTNLDTAYLQSGMREITTWLYSDTALSIFRNAYNNFLNYSLQHPVENGPILTQAQQYFINLRATTVARQCHP